MNVVAVTYSSVQMPFMPVFPVMPEIVKAGQRPETDETSTSTGAGMAYVRLETSPVFSVLVSWRTMRAKGFRFSPNW